MQQDNIADGQEDPENQDLPPSKSELKRQMHALQDIGEQLLAMPAERMKRIPLPDELVVALKAARKMNRNEARRRQMQYVGKIMRNIDVEPIRRAMDEVMLGSVKETARQHRTERWRDRIIADEQCLFELANLYPAADLQRIRVLRRNAIKDQELAKPPRAYRELFRLLRELDEAVDPPEFDTYNIDSDSNEA